MPRIESRSLGRSTCSPVTISHIILYHTSSYIIIYFSWLPDYWSWGPGFCVLFVCKCVLYCCHRVSTKCVLYCCHWVSTKCVLYCCHRVSTRSQLKINVYIKITTTWHFGNFTCVPCRGKHQIRPGTSNYSQTSDIIRTTESNPKDTSNYCTPHATRYMTFTGIKRTFTDYLERSKLPTVLNIPRRSYRPRIVWKAKKDNKLITLTVCLTLNSECQVTLRHSVYEPGNSADASQPLQSKKKKIPVSVSPCCFQQ
jgi:hypothetical protein